MSSSRFVCSNASVIINATIFNTFQSRQISSSIRICKKKVIVGKPYKTEEELAEKFIDHKLMKVFGGKGGDGRSSFLREKSRPFGGPDGGNGGNGGDVIFIADNNIKSLEKIGSIYHAPDGTDGGGTNCFGRNGKSLYVQVGSSVDLVGSTSHHTNLARALAAVS